MQWNLFCQVIDNFGDIGVCWRLAHDLATRGECVTLWTDHSEPLSWMAPAGHPRVQVQPWSQDAFNHAHNACAVGDVIIEAFGCTLPEGMLQAMARATHPPTWINLEYLSAETYAERCHGLLSPQLHGPAQGLKKWFFYPGFSAATGGLICEPNLATARAIFNPQAWLKQHQIERHVHERLVSFFGYLGPALHNALLALHNEPTLVLLSADSAPCTLAPHAQLRLHRLPYLTQTDYDKLLWCSDLNFVRGEDSFVRAQWAGKPFVWQIYAQDDGAHHAKLNAFLKLFLAHSPQKLSDQIRQLWWSCNGMITSAPVLPDQAPWAEQCLSWRTQQEKESDLVSRLMAFVQKTKALK
jgi:uncharacterized repeat protein (TIGR03837 family)